jgi:CheY-like chemotaxis protein
VPVLILTAKHITPKELAFLNGNNIHQVIQKGSINKPQLLAAISTMVSPHVQRPKPRSRTPAPPRASRKPVILVVEDNPDSMTTVKALLRDAGEVIEATDGRQGVAQARAHHPDLILMDLSMPVMDGFQAFEVIRNDDALRHVPVVALTASAMKGSREEILAHGFDAYIAKPIEEHELASTIREMLDGE